ncbi:CobW family GTP-binding protein [Humitalea sp. 24SJ18S-53]|uniref:CobW family GTP-binding protein n=1 Tax=Humitalea sp. 24SJ18S-53 TaxID=3422307 RepID=UPI003D670F39
MIPVTLLTGFLGAGKTTLLNALLKQPAMAGTAVLVNEFGEIGLDHLLVETLAEDAVLLNAGCLCCTVRGDLVTALSALAARIDGGQAVSRVVVETTGLADPAPILHTLMADPTIGRRFVLDGVVTLVDAVNGMATLDSQPEAVKQAAVADRILVTKTDLATDIAPLVARLAALNPGAPALAVVMGDVPAEAILAAGPFDPAAKTADVARWLAAEAHAHHHPHHHHHDPNRHDARIKAFCLTWDRPLPWQGVAGFLEMLTATRGDSLLRVKGMLDLEGEAGPVVVHGVQHLWHPPRRMAAWPEGTPPASTLVFILRDLDRAIVEQGLAAFIDAAR